MQGIPALRAGCIAVLMLCTACVANTPVGGIGTPSTVGTASQGFKRQFVEGALIGTQVAGLGNAVFVVFECFGQLCLAPLESDPRYGLSAASWARIEPNGRGGFEVAFTSPSTRILSLGQGGQGSTGNGLAPARTLTWSFST